MDGNCMLLCPFKRSHCPHHQHMNLTEANPHSYMPETRPNVGNMAYLESNIYQPQNPTLHNPNERIVDAYSIVPVGEPQVADFVATLNAIRAQEDAVAAQKFEIKRRGGHSEDSAAVRYPDRERWQCATGETDPLLADLVSTKEPDQKGYTAAEWEKIRQREKDIKDAGF